MSFSVVSASLVLMKVFATAAKAGTPIIQIGPTMKSKPTICLLDFQIGCRNEISVTNRLRVILSGSSGGFNNFIETQQMISDDNGYVAMDHSSSENQISLLGQFDAGLSMQISRRLRAQVGYRLLGISGVSPRWRPSPLQFWPLLRS